MNKKNLKLESRCPLYEQPYDQFLLGKSAIYRKSRELFLEYGGSYRPTLLSSARSLGSATLIVNEIAYSPIESELDWSRTDRLQRKDKKHLEQVRGFCTNVFHEQSHRILWTFFVREKLFCPQKRQEAYRFLNFIESLVVVLDMALSDDLTPQIASPLADLGILYNPGSKIMSRKALGRRNYRNALQVALQTTFLSLEGMHPEDIEREVKAAFFAFDPGMTEDAVHRGLRIDTLFVELTNPIWQKKHVSKVMKAFAPKKKKDKKNPSGNEGLVLPYREPSNYFKTYMIAEKWFDLFGL